MRMTMVPDGDLPRVMTTAGMPCDGMVGVSDGGITCDMVAPEESGKVPLTGSSSGGLQANKGR